MIVSPVDTKEVRIVYEERKPYGTITVKDHAGNIEEIEGYISEAKEFRIGDIVKRAYWIIEK